jgi:hypothetical protein
MRHDGVIATDSNLTTSRLASGFCWLAIKNELKQCGKRIRQMALHTV